MIVEGGFERAILCCRLNKKHLVPTVPPAIALLNYNRSRNTFSTFFFSPKTVFFSRIFPEERGSKAARGGGEVLIAPRFTCYI